MDDNKLQNENAKLKEALESIVLHFRDSDSESLCALEMSLIASQALESI